MWGGNGFWSPTQNKPAMKAFVDSIRRRRPPRRDRPTGGRFVAELLGVIVVAAGIYGVIELVA